MLGRLANDAVRGEKLERPREDVGRSEEVDDVVLDGAKFLLGPEPGVNLLGLALGRYGASLSICNPRYELLSMCMMCVCCAHSAHAVHACICAVSLSSAQGRHSHISAHNRCGCKGSQ